MEETKKRSLQESLRQGPPPPGRREVWSVECAGRRAKRWEWLAVRSHLKVEINKEGLIRGHWISQQGGHDNHQEISFHGRAGRQWAETGKR